MTAPREARRVVIENEVSADEARAIMDAGVSEKEWQQLVIATARAHGWLVYHTHDSRRSEPGFPDICAVREGRLVFLELKKMGGRVKGAQLHWLMELQKVPGLVVHVAWPKDWDRVLGIFAGHETGAPDDAEPDAGGG